MFVKFSGVWQVSFWNDTENASVRNESGDIEESSRDLEGESDEGGEVEARRCLGDLCEGLECTRQEGTLTEEIPAAIASETEFG